MYGNTFLIFWNYCPGRSWNSYLDTTWLVGPFVEVSHSSSLSDMFKLNHNFSLTAMKKQFLLVCIDDMVFLRSPVLVV